VDIASSKSVKLIDDTASTCCDDDVSYTSDETGSGDCSELEFPRLNWADEMESEEKIRELEFPRFNWADEMESEENFPGSFAPPGQWTSALTKLNGPPGTLVGPPGNVSGPPGYLVTIQSRHGDLVKSVKSIQRSDPEAWFRYTAEHGENTRDPRKHTSKFLEDFLRQYNNATGKICAPPGKLSAPPGHLHAPVVEKLAMPPGKLASPA
jgi:hypothetical protein